MQALFRVTPKNQRLTVGKGIKATAAVLSMAAVAALCSAPAVAAPAGSQYEVTSQFDEYNQFDRYNQSGQYEQNSQEQGYRRYGTAQNNAADNNRRYDRYPGSDYDAGFNQPPLPAPAPGYQQPDYSRPGYPHRPSQGRPFSFRGTINACIAEERTGGGWSNEMPVTITLTDGFALMRYGLFRPQDNNRQNLSGDDLFIVVDWNGYQEPALIPLGNRSALSTAATVLKDMSGKSWRISRTWRRCSR